MTFIISLAISIFLSYIVYYCFENYSFKVGAVAQIVIYFFKELISNSGNANVIALLITSVICGLIGAGINYLIYLHSSSFIGYLLLSILIGFIVSLGLTAIATTFIASAALSTI